MPANTLSVYVKSPLYDEIVDLREDKKINPTEVCVEALQAAADRIKGRTVEPEADSAPETPQRPVLYLDDPEAVNSFVEYILSQQPPAELQATVENFEYEIKYADTPPAAAALIDQAISLGGKPVSAAQVATGQIMLLIAYPPRSPEEIAEEIRQAQLAQQQAEQAAQQQAQQAALLAQAQGQPVQQPQTMTTAQLQQQAAQQYAQQFGQAYPQQGMPQGQPIPQGQPMPQPAVINSRTVPQPGSSFQMPAPQPQTQPQQYNPQQGQPGIILPPGYPHQQ